jgi:hypothetical protein
MDRVARWTQQWLDVFAGRELDRTLEGKARPLALDRAEQAIDRPGAFAVTGDARDELVHRRCYAEERLAEQDRLLADLIDRRRGLIARIEACNLAIAGTGLLGTASGTTRAQRLPHRRAVHFTDLMPPTNDTCTLPSPHDLRGASLDLLRATGDTLDLRELERLLLLGGLAVAGRSSQTLANALRPALADGSVVRVARSRYRAA